MIFVPASDSPDSQIMSRKTTKIYDYETDCKFHHLNIHPEKQRSSAPESPLLKPSRRYNTVSSMKILMVLHNLETGGAEKQTISLAKGLARNGAEVALFVFERKGNLDKEIPAEIEVFSSDIQPFRPVKTLIRVFSLMRVIKRFKPRIIYTRMEHAPVTTAGGIAGIPSVIAYVIDPRKHTAMNLWKKPVSFFRNKLSANLATHTVANSRGLAEECKKFFPLKSKPTVIYNGADLELIQKRAKETISHKWIGGEAPLCISVGRLAKQKGFESLIEAFAILNKRIKARLLIVGEGDMKNTLARKIEHLGLEDCVELVGLKVNPYNLMAVADLYVQMSVYEGFCTTILEAATLGKPIVSTDFPFGANEILEDGESGLLVPVGDTKRNGKRD